MTMTQTTTIKRSVSMPAAVVALIEDQRSQRGYRRPFSQTLVDLVVAGYQARVGVPPHATGYDLVAPPHVCAQSEDPIDPDPDPITEEDIEDQDLGAAALATLDAAPIELDVAEACEYAARRWQEEAPDDARRFPVSHAPRLRAVITTRLALEGEDFMRRFDRALARAIHVPELWGRGPKARPGFTLCLPALLGAMWEPILNGDWEPFAGHPARDAYLAADAAFEEPEPEPQPVPLAEALAAERGEAHVRSVSDPCPVAIGVWAAMRSDLEADVGPEAFRLWLSAPKVTPASMRGEDLVLWSPNSHIADWVRSRYLEALQRAAARQGRRVVLEHG